MGDQDLSTARLILRPVAARDVDTLHELWMHPDVRRFLWDDAILPREETVAVVARSEASFAASCHGLWLAWTTADTAAPIASTNRPFVPGRSRAPGGARRLAGFCGYWPFHEPPELELLYGLGRDFWGQGLATEMARAMLGHGFGPLGFDEVQASTDAPNQASIRVLQRLGMRFHRRGTEAGRDTVFYRLRREDFSPAATV